MHAALLQGRAPCKMTARIILRTCLAQASFNDAIDRVASRKLGARPVNRLHGRREQRLPRGLATRASDRVLGAVGGFGGAESPGQATTRIMIRVAPYSYVN